MSVVLRPYQNDAVQVALNCFKKDSEPVLFEIATGGGKTIIFSEIVRRILTENPRARICIVAHLDMLIRQALDKLKVVWPDAPVGVACDQFNRRSQSYPRKDTSCPVTIGSIQTLYPLMERESRTFFTHIIVDEAHRISEKSVKSQYVGFFDLMEKRCPGFRLLAVTGSVYRMALGKIYGDNEDLWFSQVNYAKTIGELQDEEFLVPYRIRIPYDPRPDFSDIPRTGTGGEMSSVKLSSVMRRPRHLRGALEALHTHAPDRQHIAVFAVDVEHARALQNLFMAAGEKSLCVHSQMPSVQIEHAYEKFEKGEIRIIVSVDMLTVGWDSTAVDCLCVCRATESLSLHLQIIGRGLRLHPGKKDCLVLDLAGNTLTHGTPRRPLMPDGDEDDPAIVVCPKCKEVNIRGLEKCRICGSPLPEKQCFNKPGARKKQKAEDFGQMNTRAVMPEKRLPPLVDWKEYDALAVMLENGAAVRPVWAQARRYSTWRGGKREIVKINLRALYQFDKDDVNSVILCPFEIYMDVAGCGKRRYIVERFWNLWGKGLCPKTVDDFLRRQNEVTWPEILNVMKKDKYVSFVLPERDAYKEFDKESDSLSQFSRGDKGTMSSLMQTLLKRRPAVCTR